MPTQGGNPASSFRPPSYLPIVPIAALATGGRQIALPRTDISNGSWVTDQNLSPSVSVTNYSRIDESIPSDYDYTQSSPAPIADQYIVALGSLAKPQNGQQILHYRYSKSLPGVTMNLKVELLQGLTVPSLPDNYVGIPTFLRHKTQVPPTGPIKVDYSHQLSSGLLSMPICNTFNSPYVYDAISQQSLQLMNGATWNGPGNYALVTNANLAGAESVCPDSLKLQPPLTVVWKGYRLALTPGTYANHFGVASNNIDANPYTSYAIGCYVDDTIAGLFNDGTNFYSYSAGPANVLGPVWAALTITNHQIGFYLRQPKISQSTGVDAPFIPSIAYSSDARLKFGSNSGQSARNSAAAHEVGYIYNRVLTTDEMAWLQAEPYCMLQPRTVQRWFGFSPSVSEGYPKFLRHATQVPQPGPITINPTHPLALGLKAMPICNTNGSNTIWDVVLQQTLPLYNGATWGGPASYAFVTNAPLAGAGIVCPDALRLQPPLTIVWKGYRLALDPGEYPTHFGVSTNNTDSSPWISYGIASSNNDLRGVFSDGTTFFSYAAGPGGDLGPVWAALTLDFHEVGFYIRDPGIYSNGGIDTPPLPQIGYSADAQYRLGANTGQSSRNSTSAHEVGYIYNRILSQSEMAWLQAEPYCMLQPHSTRRVFVPPTGPSFGVVQTWQHNNISTDWIAADQVVTNTNLITDYTNLNVRFTATQL